MAVLDFVDWLSLAACVAFTLIVSRIFICSSMALSAIFIIALPSLAFLMACFIELAWDLRLSAIAIPEESSAAEFILSPEESLEIDWFKL